MASIFKQHDLYYLQFADATRTPPRKRVPLKTSNKRKAKRRERRLLSAYHEGRFDPWTDDPRTFRRREEGEIRLSELVRRVLDEKQEQGVSDRTRKNYRGSLRRCIERIGDRRTQALTKGLLEEWYRDDAVAGATRETRYRYLNAVLNEAVRLGIIETNPLDRARGPRTSKTLPKTMYREDLADLCREVRAHHERVKGRPDVEAGDVIWRERCFRFMFCTGLRGGEIARLRWTDIDEKRGRLVVRKAKSGADQTVPLGRAAREVLQEVRRSGPFVFGKGKTRNFEAWRNNLTRAFRRYREEAGLREEITLHSLRHGFCTALAEAGKSAATIRELARHASINTSMIYVKMSAEHLRGEVDDVF